MEHFIVSARKYRPSTFESVVGQKAITKTLENAIDNNIATLILGFLFLFIQYIEYKSLSFCFSDGIYGSIFYMLTGFHGFHVIIGIIFLSVSLFRLSDYHFSRHHHFGFEASV